MYFSFFQDGASIHAIIHFIHSHTITANRLWWIIFLTTWFHHDKGCLLESCYWGQSPQKTHQIPLVDAAGCCVCCFFTLSGVLMAFLAITLPPALIITPIYFLPSCHGQQWSWHCPHTPQTHPMSSGNAVCVLFFWFVLCFDGFFGHCAATGLINYYIFASILHAMANDKANTAPTHLKLTQYHQAMLLIVVCVGFWFVLCFDGFFGNCAATSLINYYTFASILSTMADNEADTTPLHPISTTLIRLISSGDAVNCCVCFIL